MPLWGGAMGGMWGIHFTEGPVRNFADAKRADTELYGRFFRACMRRGVYLPPSAFEAAFLSMAHGQAEIDYTLEQTRLALREAVG